MAFLKLVSLVAVLAVSLTETDAHGRVVDPAHRGYAHRAGFKEVPVNYSDNGNYCGGKEVHHITNGGKCGPCGDDYRFPQPRPNENGGTFGKGVIVAKYQAGSVIPVSVQLTANHLGFFTFHMCPLESKSELETEGCFDEFPLKLATGEYKYPVIRGKNDYKVKVQLPKTLKCKQCVLRWQYTVGNSWGQCENGTGALGCGPQETFRTCSDIAIV